MRRGRLTTFHGNFSKEDFIMNLEPDGRDWSKTKRKPNQQ